MKAEDIDVGDLCWCEYGSSIFLGSVLAIGETAAVVESIHQHPLQNERVHDIWYSRIIAKQDRWPLHNEQPAKRWWEFWSNAAVASYCLIAAILVILATYRCRRPIERNIELTPLLIVPILAITGLVSGAGACVSRAAKVAIAPRVVLIEKVSEFVKK